MFPDNLNGVAEIVVHGVHLCQTLQIKKQFLRDWQRAKVYTLDYLNTMPADKYSFRPVDSIRSFAGQMLHLAWDESF